MVKYQWGWGGGKNQQISGGSKNGLKSENMGFFGNDIYFKMIVEWFYC